MASRAEALASVIPTAGAEARRLGGGSAAVPACSAVTVGARLRSRHQYCTRPVEGRGARQHGDPELERLR